MKLLIFGFGYSAQAFAQLARPLCESLSVTARSVEKCARLTAEGWDALAFDGTRVSPPLAEAVAGATHLLVSVPPDAAGDPVLNAARPLLAKAERLTCVLYLSTVGVYGDHQGAWVDETSTVKPISARSLQRVAAENAWQDFAREKGCDLGIFRLSGIYGPGRSAVDALKAGTARRIIKPGQVFNRIHVKDIAGALLAAITHHGPLGVFNLTDDEPCPPQDVVDYAAKRLGLPLPPEIPFEEAALSEMARSFYGENKRVSNALIKQKLGYEFVCPSFREGIDALIAGSPAMSP